MNKHIKPNLLDPILSKKIIMTLNPPKEDYWEPAKNFSQILYQKYIRPNIMFIIFLLFVLLILFYRYRIVKTERDRKNLEGIIVAEQSTDNYNSSISSTLQPDSTNDGYAQIAMLLYNSQKDASTEPKIRMPPNTSNRIEYIDKNQSPGYVYPVYPHFPGGKFVSSKSKKRRKDY
jgi:hypothetical protein